MERINWFMRGAAHHTTMWIGARFGEKFPMHFVCGYPRSGTTWFSELLADYLNLPRPNMYIFPIGFASVIHTHVPPSHRLNDCFYVVRDGRDSIVSAYFKAIERLKNDTPDVYRNKLLKVFDDDLDNIAHNLPAYIQFRFEEKGQNWGTHVLGWLQKAQRYPKQIVVVKYEDMLSDPEGTFTKVLQEKYGDVDKNLVAVAVQRQQFDRQRKRPSDQHRTYMRKGVAGDWRNWFTPECNTLFEQYAGEALKKAGYSE